MAVVGLVVKGKGRELEWTSSELITYLRVAVRGLADQLVRVTTSYK